MYFITTIWQITEADWHQAREQVQNTSNRNGARFEGNAETILDDNGDHLIDGALGEILWQKHVCPQAQKIMPGPKGTEIEADFVIDGIRIDVKTKRRNGPMRSHYVTEVDHNQRNHDADLYAFLSLDTQNWTMEYIACISKKTYQKLAWIMEKGTILESPSGKPYPVLKTCLHLDAETVYDNQTTIPNFITQPKPQNTKTMNKETQPNTFVLFPNDYATTDKHPQWKGKITLADGTEQQIVGWEKVSAAGKKFISGKFAPYQAQRQEAATDKSPF